MTKIVSWAASTIGIIAVAISIQTLEKLAKADKKKKENQTK